MTSKTILGRTEYIDIVDEGIVGVAAKVDTGAFSCTIWASDIREDADSMLRFKLYDPQTENFSQQETAIKDYKRVRIVNSFGNYERRYRVPLKICVAGREIDTLFTLSNRSGNRFPALIGRRLLHNGFVVDVSYGISHPHEEEHKLS